MPGSCFKVINSSKLFERIFIFCLKNKQALANPGAFCACRGNIFLKEVLKINACEMAVAILRATDDGDRLDPRHLSLVERAINYGLEGLSDNDREQFRKLYAQATGSEGYRRPWLHGIENLTIDNDGYVYWKQHRVEHYSMPWAWSQEGKKEAEEVARRCKHLESIGVTPSVYTVIWGWEKYAPFLMYP